MIPTLVTLVALALIAMRIAWYYSPAGQRARRHRRANQIRREQALRDLHETVHRCEDRQAGQHIEIHHNKFHDINITGGK
jgi:hypothetical protein